RGCGTEGNLPEAERDRLRKWEKTDVRSTAKVCSEAVRRSSPVSRIPGETVPRGKLSRLGGWVAGRRTGGVSALGGSGVRGGFGFLVLGEDLCHRLPLGLLRTFRCGPPVGGRARLRRGAGFGGAGFRAALAVVPAVAAIPAAAVAAGGRAPARGCGLGRALRFRIGERTAGPGFPDREVQPAEQSHRAERDPLQRVREERPSLQLGERQRVGHAGLARLEL